MRTVSHKQVPTPFSFFHPGNSTFPMLTEFISTAFFLWSRRSIMQCLPFSRGSQLSCVTIITCVRPCRTRFNGGAGGFYFVFSFGSLRSSYTFQKELSQRWRRLSWGYIPPQLRKMRFFYLPCLMVCKIVETWGLASPPFGLH